MASFRRNDRRFHRHQGSTKSSSKAKGKCFNEKTKCFITDRKWSTEIIAGDDTRVSKERKENTKTRRTRKRDEERMYNKVPKESKIIEYL